MSLILSEEEVEKVAARLEKESEICHLLVMCTYHTGWHPSRTIQLSTIGAEYFINQNRDFLYDWEIDLLRTYKLENLNNNIVFSNKETGDNISLSDVERLLSKVSSAVLDGKTVTFKMLTMTFYYNLLRECNYCYETVKNISACRGFCFPNLQVFLKECEMDESEHRNEKINNLLKDVDVYKALCIEIIDVIGKTMNSLNTSTNNDDEIDEKIALMAKVFAVHDWMRKNELF